MILVVVWCMVINMSANMLMYLLLMCYKLYKIAFMDGMFMVCMKLILYKLCTIKILLLCSTESHDWYVLDIHILCLPLLMDKRIENIKIKTKNDRFKL
jgi:hypothetical protein